MIAVKDRNTIHKTKIGRRNTIRNYLIGFTKYIMRTHKFPATERKTERNCRVKAIFISALAINLIFYN